MKRKTIFSLFLCVLLLLSLTACGARKALSADQFKSKMEAKGYTLVDAVSQFQKGTVKKAYLAMKDKKYQIEFYQVPSEEQAISAFEQNKTSFEASKGKGSANSETSGKNFNTYTLTSNGLYMIVSRIDDTFIYLKVPGEYKDEVKELVKELGY